MSRVSRSSTSSANCKILIRFYYLLHKESNCAGMQFLSIISISEESMINVNSKFDRKHTSQGLDMRGSIILSGATIHYFADIWQQNIVPFKGNVCTHSSGLDIYSLTEPCLLLECWVSPHPQNRADLMINGCWNFISKHFLFSASVE